ncbi:MAG: peptidoglycan DD-metalloendopeptidase family protein [Xanthomonadales bacterium]|nr:peptidoglycan DD-metalloendopeptidase family protein [Xanthomonadales bacterium]
MPAFPSAQDIDPAARAAQEKEAKQKLEAVRAEVRTLTAQQHQTRGERNEAVKALREQELAVAEVARQVQQLDDELASRHARLGELEARKAELATALSAQREALAALLRSAYALGQHEELKLLLQQDDIAAIARVLAYHRYFQRARVERIDTLMADLRELAAVEESIQAEAREIDRSRAERAAEGERLAAGRAAREELVARIDAQLGDQAARIAALGKDEAALSDLLEKLRDIFADIPRQLPQVEPFAAIKGRLAWPLRGRVLTAFGAADESGRPSSGILIGADPGTQVRAVSHGRVAFADWLRGYGLMIIVDHGDGWLSLYGGNETLSKGVGDWIDAGQPVATSGSSGGQRKPGLYFELRAKGKPVDPRGWLGK